MQKEMLIKYRNIEIIIKNDYLFCIFQSPLTPG